MTADQTAPTPEIEPFAWESCGFRWAWEGRDEHVHECRHDSGHPGRHVCRCRSWQERNSQREQAQGVGPYRRHPAHRDRREGPAMSEAMIKTHRQALRSHPAQPREGPAMTGEGEVHFERLERALGAWEDDYDPTPPGETTATDEAAR